ncbi:hypothetical protein OHT57_05000 [Streptomyces sp. NBC_00285]|uniref:hypothetical protein n=1 Tax=Streptomyces sp. NBC_00285 TaxID=2975700 RepID=UPI002E2E5EE1|nr:hypothetical protein [Streptomyces sp. NBC_00285]
MLHTVLRRRANGESVEQIQPDLIIPTGRRKGQHPSVASICRALAEHAKRKAHPEAIEQAHADFAAVQADQVPGPHLTVPDRASRLIAESHLSLRCSFGRRGRVGPYLQAH